MLTVMGIEGGKGGEGVGGGVFNSVETRENTDNYDVRQLFHPHLKI